MKILTQRERLYYVRNANCDGIGNCDAIIINILCDTKYDKKNIVLLALQKNIF